MAVGAGGSRRGRGFAYGCHAEALAPQGTPSEAWGRGRRGRRGIDEKGQGYNNSIACNTILQTRQELQGTPRRPGEASKMRRKVNKLRGWKGAECLGQKKREGKGRGKGLVHMPGTKGKQSLTCGLWKAGRGREPFHLRVHTPSSPSTHPIGVAHGAGGVHIQPLGLVDSVVLVPVQEQTLKGPRLGLR